MRLGSEAAIAHCSVSCSWEGQHGREDYRRDRPNQRSGDALCGFANVGSLGILIGGLSAMVPKRRDEVLQLGTRSIVAGTLATCCTGAVVGILIP